MPTIAELVADLAVEQAALAGLLGDLSQADWDKATPSPGWSIGDQVAHLAASEKAAALAVSDPERFVKLRESDSRLEHGQTSTTVGQSGALRGADLLKEWTENCRRFQEAASNAREAFRVPWVGPSMSVASMVTARIMETWAHSRDIRDGLGVIHPPTAALLHVAFLGYATREFSYVNRGLEPDHTPLRLELVGPNREGWNFGPSEPGTQAVRGWAEDFCLVVTRRRHLDDTGLSVEPGPAREWMLIAQAFAGPQGSDPPRLPGPEAHKGQSELREEEMPRPSKIRAEPRHR